MAHTYKEQFYEAQMNGSYRSAKIVLTHLQTLLPKPKSVIDVGCGVGTWLKAWREEGSEIAIFGIDGNEVEEQLYQIPLESYQRVDLTQNYQTLIQNIQHSLQSSGGGG